MNPLCSKCRKEIPAVDINVAHDVAFCRACNLAHKLSELVHGATIDVSIDVTRPPQGTWYQSTGLGAVVGASHRSWASAIGLLVFTTFWNGIVSVFVALALSSTLHQLGVHKPEWLPAPQMNGSNMGIGMTLFLWLFLTPFILIGLATFAAFLSALAGRTEVRIHHAEGMICTGIGPLSSRRRFNAGTVKDVRITNEQWQTSKGRRGSKSQIVLETQDGKQLKFGSMLRPERMQFVAAVLRKTFSL